jgi:glycosyltransferase involved in cell wall biosynthesis
MRCPSLSDLPSPPPKKTGWPWTEESRQLPELMPDGSEWPQISIVTPNYNYGRFIEETIRSILLQGYPNLEFIVIDGASTDNSVEIIKKYDSWITYWVSEKDQGQANAINKGIEYCTGKIFNWINSDDRLTPASLGNISLAIGSHSAFAGVVRNFDDNSSYLITNQRLSAVNMAANPVFHQPGLWLKIDNLYSVLPVSEFFEYCFDWDLTIRYLSAFPDINYSTKIVCDFRLHVDSKTINERANFEIERDKVRVKFLEDESYRILHSKIKIHFRYKQWYKLLEEISLSRNISKLQKGKQIFIGACADPKIRWNRLTLGAIRRVLFK